VLCNWKQEINEVLGLFLLQEICLVKNAKAFYIIQGIGETVCLPYAFTGLYNTFIANPEQN